MKKSRQLLFQIIMIVLSLFALLTAAVALTIYHSTINGFLKAQNIHIEELMPKVNLDFVLLDEEKPEEIKLWFLDQLKKADFDYSKDLTDEQVDRLVIYEEEDDALSYSWYERMPDDIRHLFLQSYFYSINGSISYRIENTEVQSVFLMDLQPDRQGLVLFEYSKNGSGKKIGEYFDFDIGEHPVLKEMTESTSSAVRFEKAVGFPDEGNCYTGFKPVIINGKTRAVIGITYKWDDLRDSVIHTIIHTIIITASGIVLIMLILVVFIYRAAVRPVRRIQKAIIDYTGDKDSARIVGEMFRIKTKNELEYLSDSISDLALEIDHYIKETARIAAEKERAEKDRYEAEVQIMVSQISPHFMYNALTSIAMMCELDPKTAKEAIIVFAKYLRGNMDSLKQTAPVPFERELEHLKKYLYIEKLRFDDLLNIEYDIRTTDFEVPLLSIQPLAENAVKHGVGMNEDGGTVKISAVETDTAYEVIISDDGVGFDVNAPKKDDGRSHVGMENTRKRLKEMCGADIVITSEIGKGTTARVIIPKEKKEGKDEDTVS